MLENILSILSGYLIGSIPFSYIIAKLRRINLKERVKNGQIGAAAVKRNCGLFPAIFAGIGDFSKGALAVFIAKKLAKQDWVVVLSGLAAIIGHNWSIFLKFWGGKGALVSFGALFYLLPIPFFLCLPLIIPFLLVKREKIF
jgi:glycerol-3-phosphate acyltransferase PlsY